MQEKQDSQQTPVIPFDFVVYLDKLLGSGKWETETLQGGAANYIVRARRLSSTLSNNIANSNAKQHSAHSHICTPDSHSIIIKQAPPFLAKCPEIAFSPYRQACHSSTDHTLTWYLSGSLQTIEAKALRVFQPLDIGNTLDGLANVLSRNPTIRIPKLLYHDRFDNVLIQSDLGSLPNLHEVLISPTTTAAALGNVIGQFLSDMHDPVVVLPEYVEMFSNISSGRTYNGGLHRTSA